MLRTESLPCASMVLWLFSTEPLNSLVIPWSSVAMLVELWSSIALQSRCSIRKSLTWKTITLFSKLNKIMDSWGMGWTLECRDGSQFILLYLFFLVYQFELPAFLWLRLHRSTWMYQIRVCNNEPTDSLGYLEFLVMSICF